MILTSHQPNFLPYMGVIYKAYKSDAIVLSDDVCYSKKGCTTGMLSEQRMVVKRLPFL